MPSYVAPKAVEWRIVLRARAYCRIQLSRPRGTLVTSKARLRVRMVVEWHADGARYPAMMAAQLCNSRAPRF